MIQINDEHIEVLCDVNDGKHTITLNPYMYRYVNDDGDMFLAPIQVDSVRKFIENLYTVYKNDNKSYEYDIDEQLTVIDGITK